MLRIVHLTDDTNPGGVTRYLRFLASDPDLALLGRHEVRPVPRHAPAARRIEADLIVSHLTVTWRGLPGLMLLWARHPRTTLFHVEQSYSAGFVAANVTARRRFHALLRTAYALFDRVVAVSRTQGTWLARRSLVAESALAVIPPCVDLAPFRALPAPDAAIRTIGVVGRFDRQKGFNVLMGWVVQAEPQSLTASAKPRCA